MKKSIFLIALIAMIVILTSCSGGKFMGIFIYNDSQVANARFDEILEAIKNKDAAALKKVFSKDVINKVENLDEKIDELFVFVKGDVVSYENPCGGPNVNSGRNVDGSGRIYYEMQSPYEVETTTEKYRFCIQEFTKDTANQDNVGVTSLCVIKYKDSNTEYVYRKIAFGIVIDQKQE